MGQVPKHPIRPGDGDPRHGTVGGYTNHRCHCPACQEAHTATCRAEREKRPPLPPGDERHGTVGGYTNHRCRCADCTAAQAKAVANWYRAHKPTTEGTPQ